MAQVTAAALVSENKVLAHPASVDSITTSGNKEDYVSMGMTASLKLKRIVGLTHPDNLISQKVLDKIGFKYTRLDFYYGIRVRLFEITKSTPTFETQ